MTLNFWDWLRRVFKNDDGQNHTPTHPNVLRREKPGNPGVVEYSLNMDCENWQVIPKSQILDEKDIGSTWPCHVHQKDYPIYNLWLSEDFIGAQEEE